MRILGLLMCMALFAQAPDADLPKLSFITGCWQMRTANGMTIEEQWTKPAGGTMLGVGRTIRGGKTVFTEFLRISVEEGKLTYTARIGTKGITPFPLLRISDTEVVFENPTHDFPQRIIYRKQYRNEAGGLFARIEGVDKGKERHEDFPYKKVSCELP